MKKSGSSKSREKEKNKLGIDRRTFLRWSAFTGAAVGASKVLSQLDTPGAQPLSQKNQSVPEEKWMVTSCLNCQARCAIRVRVVNGKAVKITGNSLSKVSEGKICPRGHVGLQVLYDPGRINTPLKRRNNEKGNGIDPQWISITWDEALNEITNRLNKLRAKGEPNQLLLFYGLNTISSQDMIFRFAEAFGTPNVISGDGLDSETEKSGNWMADGHYAQTAYDLDHTNFILAFGADMLESSKPLSRFLRKWGRIRREKPNRTKIVVINPRYSITAAKADEWIPLRPGTEGPLAMAVAHVIMSEDLFNKIFVRDWTVGFESYKKLALSQYSPEDVSKITGIQPETIRRIAREFAQTQPALALRGQESINWPEGSFTSYAIFCLNALVGSIDVPGGVLYQESVHYNEMPRLAEDEIVKKGKTRPIVDFRGTDRFPAAKVVTNQIPESLSENVPYPIEMAIGFNSNFNMLSPGTDRWDRALKKLPYYIHVSPFVSEMALYADLVLPSTTFLEEWGYDHSPPGSGFAEVKIKQPAVVPRGSARSVIDILFQMAKRLNGGVAESFANLGDHAEGFVKFRTETLVPWKEFLKKGVGARKDYEYQKYPRIFQTHSKKFEFSSGNLRTLLAKTKKGNEEGLDYLPHPHEAKFLGNKEKYPLILLPYQPLMVIENGSQNYPWAQEIFLPMDGVGWETLAEMNSETAKSLKLRDGQLVWVESPFRKIRAKVKFSEGVHPDVVALPSGQGHTSYGQWQKGIGVNPNEIIGVDYDTLSGQAAFYNTRVRVYKA
ncbi:MAG TPA: molybdopterin-dependent oxidoreductase [Thermodesulfobacteriota bacterium]|nr:molybdopterin-dependent oxidoreductase [Thermodesulfobacteriota bacterium]